MKGSIFWKLFFSLILIGWTVSSIFPVTDTPLKEYLVSEASDKKEDFAKLLDRAKIKGEEMDKVAQAKNPNAPRTSLFLGLQEVLLNEKDATGQPYDLSKFFTHIDVRGIKSLAKRNSALLRHLLQKSQGKVKLGLDLNGGIAATFKIKQVEDAQGAPDSTEKPASPKDAPEKDKPKATDAVDPKMIEKAIEVISARVDAFGLAEPIVRLIGTDRIEVQLPGISTKENPDIIKIIGKPAVLQFCEVAQQRASEGAKAPPGFRLASLDNENKRGDIEVEWLFISKLPMLTGDAVAKAQPSLDPNTGAPYISFVMTSEGGKMFGDITKRLIGRRFAIVLDKKLVSAPVIQSAITGGSGQITGNFSIQEAQELANTLNNPLKVGLDVTDVQEIAPTLATESQQAAVKACYYGGGIVIGFIVGYYYGFAAGLVAAVSLIATMFMIVGTMCSLGASFSLPAIGALVVTIGMAVDAQILIYERIHEELDQGKSLSHSIKAGFELALSTIVDANLTTLISGVILIAYGSGAVRGFGVALSIGIVATVFSALVITRLLMDLVVVAKTLVTIFCSVILLAGFGLLAFGTANSGHLSDILISLAVGGVIAGVCHVLRRALASRKSDVPFMKYAKPAFICTWIVVGIGVIGVVVNWHKMWSIDFVGGDEYRLSFKSEKLVNNNAPLSAEEIQKKIASPALGEVILSFSQVLGGGERSLKIQTEAEKGEAVVKALQTAYPEAAFTVTGNFKAGPAVGARVQREAIISVLLAIIGILIYVGLRFEWGYGVGALVTTLHDVLMTIGLYVLMGGQFSGSLIAAILMIIGYSVNDTVVVFDRIREELEKNKHMNLAQIINHSISVTLSRTILTSATTFFATTALYVFGVGLVQDFALIFLIGIVTGTFSSIFVAAPIFYYWHKGDRSDVEASKDIIPTYEWESGGPSSQGKGKGKSNQPILEGDTGA